MRARFINVTRGLCWLLASSAGLCTPLAFAQQAPEDWDCAACDGATGWAADVTLAPAFVFDDAYRFGNQTGLDESALNLFGDFSGRYVNSEALFLDFEGYLRGSDAMRLSAEGGRQGRYAIRASYQAIPQRLFDTGVTPFLGVGSDFLSLPDSWIRGANTSLMTELDDAAAPLAIGLDWTNLALGFDVDLLRDWDLKVDYVRREKDGIRRSAGNFLFNSLEFAAPVDYATDDVTVKLDYRRSNWQVGVSYFGSTFSNNNESLTWDNPYRAISGDNQGQNAQPPDNSSHQFSVSGSIQLPSQTSVSGQASIGRLEQNEALLPYTLNATLVTDPLPVARSGGEVSTRNLNLRAVTSPVRNLRLNAELRYNNFDNQTPRNAFRPVLTDVALTPGLVTSRAYDYERSELRLGGNYRLRRGMRLYAGYDAKTFKRNLQERRETDTGRLWLRLRARMRSIVQADLQAFTEERDGSNYVPIDDGGAPQNPLMRKYNLADRDRDGWQLRLALLAIDGVDLGLSIENAEDDYRNSLIGLTSSDYSRVGMNGSWQISSRSSVYASIDVENVETEQANSQSFSAADWMAATDDRIESGTIGTNYAGLFGSFNARLDFSWSDARGEIRNDTSGFRTDFPDTRSVRRTLSAGLEYPFSDALTLGFQYFYEELETDDWSLDGVEPDTALNLLGLGAQAWNYDANVIYVSARYQVQPR